MNSQLILHHPYRSLNELQTQFQLTQEENALAWSIINDHYLTDLPLLHAPHVIAITAMFLAVVLKPTQGGLQMSAAGTANALQALGNARGVGGAGAQSRVQKLVDWLAESNVDIEAVVETTQELISLYGSGRAIPTKRVRIRSPNSSRREGWTNDGSPIGVHGVEPEDMFINKETPYHDSKWLRIFSV
jgi:hypothetical protein